MKLAAILLFSSVVKPIVQGACDYCTAGFDDPNAQIPFSGDGGVTDCQGIRAEALNAPAEECETYSQLEPFCCPSTTEQFICDFCSFEVEVDNNMICGFMLFGALAANETEACAVTKIYEPVCCPSKADYKLPPVTEGDQCFLCGDSGVAMTTPDAKPLAIQESEDPNDHVTCAQSQDALNEQRKDSNGTCADALYGLYVMFSPSVCGCQGFSPPNACKMCDGGTVNRDVASPEGNITCGETYDLLQHVTPGGCAILNLTGDFDLAAIDETCCAYASSGHAKGLSLVGLLVTGLLLMITA